MCLDEDTVDKGLSELELWLYELPLPIISVGADNVGGVFVRAGDTEPEEHVTLSPTLRLITSVSAGDEEEEPTTGLPLEKENIEVGKSVGGVWGAIGAADA